MKILAGTGNWNTAATWYDDTNVASIHASTNLTLTTSGILGATFTAPSTSDDSKGTLFWLTAKNSTATITAELEEYDGISTWVKKAEGSCSTTDLVNLSWVRIDWDTPYTFATTTASYYRIRFKSNTGSSAATVAADSGGSLVSYQAFDDRTGVPSSEPAYCLFEIGNTGTVTLDGTVDIVGTDAVNNTVGRSITFGLYGGYGATIKGDRASSSTINQTNQWFFNQGSTKDFGTEADPIPYAVKLTVNKISGSCWQIFQGTGKNYEYGEPPPSGFWKTTYSSGSGITASPLITADAVDWEVGDEIHILPTSNDSTNYNQTETKFIITKNSSTSYVLSNTSGGAEAGLTYSHTGAEILLLTRNVQVLGTTYFHCVLGGNTAELSTMAWSRHQYINGSNNRQSINVNGSAKCDYVVVDRAGTSSFSFTGTEAQTYTGLISANNFHGAGGSSANSAYQFSGSNKTLVNCYAAVSTNAHSQLTGYSNQFNQCVFVSGNTGLNANFDSLNLLGGKNIFYQCKFNANRTTIRLSSSNDNRFIECEFGTLGNNQVRHVGAASATFNTALFQRCNFGTGTLMNNYLNMFAGSEVVFENMDGVDYKNLWYTPNGAVRFTGASLSDTTTRTVGNYTLRIDSETAIGQEWEFNVPAVAGSIVSVPVYIWQNATFVSDGSSSVVVDLYLPGSTAIAATKTMTKTADNTSNNANGSISATYSGDTDGVATVRITAKTTTAGAYCYVADPFNGGNTITGFRTTRNGQPLKTMVLQVADPIAIAQAVWSDSNTYTVGTKGGDIADIKNRPQPQYIVEGEIIG